MYDDKNAVYALNSYIWKLLEANLGWSKSDYGDKTPIIPFAQQPELLATGKPFLVYGSAIAPSNHLFSLRRESVSYMIYSTSSTELNKIVDLLNETFARQDEAAADVNQWLDTEAPHRATPRGISFCSIRSTMSEKANDVADEEGGNYSGLVMLETTYVILNSNIVTSGFTY
jgi:hypothetical protein